ncbi:transcription factor, zf-fungal binuclear cluster type (predicted) [Sugiyamaella lignohabitans]|uniref:Transcription factor, zf-fungal binuclear cluster type (Predicted) n=1 Tax=Sugiyamaella lignohabitans TaxID=796027 RepID=A0A167D8T7_9ASCO|nr:transcription factor, zf-fungal binuclear cluster type (predicted) [Sugiyamaella lignohabitans]ANB12622.1 transcription factor, zf-fungal binuclear cluster type (predicted) [Sugiyamaella lignohabitans]
MGAIFQRLDRLERQVLLGTSGSVCPSPSYELQSMLSPSSSSEGGGQYCWNWPPGIDKTPGMKELVNLVETVRDTNNLPPCEWPNLKRKFQIFTESSNTDYTSFLPPKHIHDMLLARYKEVVHPIMPIIDLVEITERSEGFWSDDKSMLLNDAHFMAIYFLILSYSSRSSGYDVQNHNVTSSLHRLFINAAEHFMSFFVYVGSPDIKSFEAILLYSMFMFAGETVQSGRAITSLVNNMAQIIGLYKKEPRDRRQADLFKIFYSFEKSSALDIDQPSFINDRYCYFNSYRSIDLTNCTGFVSAQFQLSRLLSKVVDEVYGRSSCPSQETIRSLDSEISQAIESIPSNLKVSQIVQVSPGLLMQQYIIDTLAHKILFMLHKSFISRRNSAGQLYAEYEFSRRRGLEACVRLMKNQMDVFSNQELQEFVWCHWHCIYYQAFFAALLTGLDYKQCKELSDEINAPGKDIMELVETMRNQYFDMRIATMCASARSHLVLSAVLQVKSEFDIPHLFGPFSRASSTSGDARESPLSEANQPTPTADGKQLFPHGDKRLFPEVDSMRASPISDDISIDTIFDDKFFENICFTNASAIYSTSM